jgi:hypothetical protein
MSPGAKKVIERLVGQVLDWQQKLAMRGANTTETFMVAGAAEPGAVDAEGNLYFDQALVADPLERAMREQHVSDENRRAFNGALHLVATTALIRRLDHTTEWMHEAPSFEDRAAREAFVRLRATDLVTATTKRLVGPYPNGEASASIDETVLAVDAPTLDPVARTAGLALVGNYADATGQLDHTAAHELLKMPRNEIFDEVARHSLRSQLHNDGPVPQELQDRVARELREGFQQISQLSPAGTERRLEICDRVDGMFAEIKRSAEIANGIMRHVRGQALDAAFAQENQGSAPAPRSTVGKSTGKSGFGLGSGS